MLTFQDCIDLAGVTEAEIEAIAKHERIPAMIALELADHMLHTPAGAVKLRDFIVENLLRAQGRNNCTDCAKLGRLLAGWGVESQIPWLTIDNGLPRKRTEEDAEFVAAKAAVEQGEE
jgi:hypothetical protein